MILIKCIYLDWEKYFTLKMFWVLGLEIESNGILIVTGVVDLLRI